MWQKMLQMGSGGGVTPEPPTIELVPHMTSNIAPYGEAISSTPNTSSYEAFQAFSDEFTIVNGRGFLPKTGVTNAEIGYEFRDSAIVKRVGVHCFSPASVVTASNQTYKIYGLVGGTWKPVDGVDYTCPADGVVYHDINSSEIYDGIKLVFSTVLNVDGNVKYTLVRAQFYGYIP